jgi:hypothetical protein
MASSSVFVGGVVEYTAKLDRLLLPETTFPAHDPVREVRVSCDGRDAKLNVLLGPVDSEELALTAADDAMLRVWGAFLVGIPACFTSVSPPVRRDCRLERPPTPGVLYVPAASMTLSAGIPTITITPGPDAVQVVRDISAAPSWSPSASLPFQLFERALSESDYALQFLALYAAVVLSLETAGDDEREPRQQEVDAELMRLDATVSLLPPEGEKGKPETPFTRARNRLLHPRGRRVSWSEAKAYAANQLQAFRTLVAKRVVDAAVGVP